MFLKELGKKDSIGCIAERISTIFYNNIWSRFVHLTRL